VKNHAPYRNYASDQGIAMPKKIMIVDDEVGVRMLIGMILERAGYDVLRAADATEALEVVNRIVPDLFIIDQMMPGMTGLELCGELRKDPRVDRKPILMLSARSDVNLIQESRNIGVNQYLVKPVLSEELVQHVNSWVGERPQ
jgi:DNA-binding response OmpR family regulator